MDTDAVVECRREAVVVREAAEEIARSRIRLELRHTLALDGQHMSHGAERIAIDAIRQVERERDVLVDSVREFLAAEAACSTPAPYAWALAGRNAAVAALREAVRD